MSEEMKSYTFFEETADKKPLHESLTPKTAEDPEKYAQNKAAEAQNRTNEQKEVESIMNEWNENAERVEKTETNKKPQKTNTLNNKPANSTRIKPETGNFYTPMAEKKVTDFKFGEMNYGSLPKDIDMNLEDINEKLGGNIQYGLSLYALDA